MKKLPNPSADWPESWQLSYDFDAREWGPDHSRPAYRYAYQLRIASIQRALERTSPPPITVVDVGAAQGTLSLRLAEAGYIVTWNDYREDLVGYVQLKYERGQIYYAPGDIFQSDKVGTFDAVVCAEVIEHVAHPDELLSKLASLTKPGRPVVVSTPNGDNLFNKLPSFFEIPDPALLEPAQFQPDSNGHLFLLLPSELQILAERAGLRVRSLDLVQTHLVYAVAKVMPKALRLHGFVSLLHWVDSLLVKLPLLGRKLAVQMVAVLETG